MLNGDNLPVGSRRETAPILSRLASIAMPWRKSDGGKEHCVRFVFVGEWRQSDKVCSVVLAQAPALSGRYRRLFLQDAAKLVVPSLGGELRDATDRDASIGYTAQSGVLGEVTVFVRFDNGLVLGVENVKPRSLEKKSRLRYDEYLQLRNSDPILMMLIPRAKALSSQAAQELDRFEAFACEHFRGWADGCLVDWLGHATPELEFILQNMTNQPPAATTPDRSQAGAMQPSLD